MSMSNGQRDTTRPYPPVGEQRVEVVALLVTRFADDSPNRDTWSVKVEAAGFGRWAVRNGSRCLSKALTWDYEPQPSSRDDDWLDEHRWASEWEAVTAAQLAEPSVTWNGFTPAMVRAAERASEKGTSGVV